MNSKNSVKVALAASEAPFGRRNCSQLFVAAAFVHAKTRVHNILVVPLFLSLSLSLLHNNRHTNTFVYCPTVPNVCFLVLLSAAITTHAHTHHPSLLSLSFYIPTSVYLLNTLSLPISFTYTLSLCLFFSRFTSTYYNFLSTFLHLSIS